MAWIFSPVTGKPIGVPNDNYVNPGANYYFLENPSLPFNAATNPYIGNLGTNEGNDPNTLRSMPQLLVNLHLEHDVTPRMTLIVDVVNLFDKIYEIRDGSGIGVFAPQFGARRGFYAGLSQKL